jgi:hypothetical protein
MIRLAAFAGLVLGLGAAVMQLSPAPRAAVRPLSERTLPASAFAAPFIASQPLDINPATTRMMRTPWGEVVAIDSRASRLPLVSNWGWTIYANGDVSAANGTATAQNPLTPVQ